MPTQSSSRSTAKRRVSGVEQRRRQLPGAAANVKHVVRYAQCRGRRRQERREVHQLTTHSKVPDFLAILTRKRGGSVATARQAKFFLGISPPQGNVPDAGPVGAHDLNGAAIDEEKAAAWRAAFKRGPVVFSSTP